MSLKYSVGFLCKCEKQLSKNNSKRREARAAVPSSPLRSLSITTGSACKCWTAEKKRLSNLHSLRNGNRQLRTRARPRASFIRQTKLES